ncbi:MAG: hypothetical protein KDD64_02380 [Bdellovibrionales bacterium]|nr:hypothetical protein [Bdellovibrionales bacterium]
MRADALPPCNDHAISPEQASVLHYGERQVVRDLVDKIEIHLQANFGVDWATTIEYHLKPAVAEMKVPDSYKCQRSVLKNVKIVGELVRIFEQERGWKVSLEGTKLIFSNPPQGYLEDNARVRQRSMSAITEVNEALRLHFGRDGKSSVKLPLPAQVNDPRILRRVIEGFEKKGWSVKALPVRSAVKEFLDFVPEDK